jgi:hypothetical protein
MTRRMAWLVIVVAGVVAAACTSGFKMEPPPPNAQRTLPAWLVGTWEAWATRLVPAVFPCKERSG